MPHLITKQNIMNEKGKKKTHNKNINIRPNKIKVMVLRQCSPLK